MNHNLTELVFILDRSGSMSGLEADTLGGYNSLLAKHQALPGECRITTLLFDHEQLLLHDRVDIRHVQPMTLEQYMPRGSTALLDALGTAINRLGYLQKHTPAEQRAGQVMLVIVTDGMENASREYSQQQVRRMVERQQQRFGWEFLFLGANMDAITTAAGYGIDESRAATFRSDGTGVEAKYQVVAEITQSFRSGRRDFSERLRSLDE